MTVTSKPHYHMRLTMRVEVKLCFKGSGPFYSRNVGLEKEFRLASNSLKLWKTSDFSKLGLITTELFLISLMNLDNVQKN